MESSEPIGPPSQASPAPIVVARSGLVRAAPWLGAFAALCCAAVYFSEPRPPAQAPPPPPPEEAPMVVDVADIGTAIEQNAIAARLKYSGHVLDFTGRLYTLDATANGGAKLGVFSFPPVSCSMRLGQDARLATLDTSKMTPLRLQGRLVNAGKVLEMVDCVLISP